MAFTAWNKTTPPTGKQATFELMTMLVAAGWVVLAAGTGTSGTYEADVVANGNPIASAANLASNAWFRIRDPGGGAEFVFQVGTTNTTLRIKHSRAAGFVGGAPSATQVPSATDEAVFWGAGSDASPTYATAYTTDNSYRWLGGADSATGYGWWMGAYPLGGGVPSFGMVYDPLVGTIAGDTCTHAFHVAATGGGGAPFGTATLTLETPSVTAGGIWSYLASAGVGTFVGMPALTYNSNGGVVYPSAGSTDPITNEDPGLPIVLARRGAIANPGYKGVTSVMRWNGIGSRGTGETHSDVTTRDRIIFRDLTLPWDGTVPPV